MNKEPITYEDWLNLGKVIIPCYKGVPKKGITGYTKEDFKIEKDIWNRDHEKAEIALRLDDVIDLDIDNNLVKNFLNFYLNDCGAIFGRDGNPSSHYIWSNKTKIPFKQFSLPDEFEKDYKDFPHGAMICELRTERKRYTIVPGSLHSKTKTNVRWEKYQDIREYQGNLTLDVGKIALSSALTIIYPGEGKRDEYCTAIAGILLKNSDWTEEQINLFIARIAEAANDDVRQRSNKGTSTAKTDRKFGINKISELTGYSHKSIQSLFNWIGLFQNITAQVSNDMIEKIEQYSKDRYYVYLNVPDKEETKQKRSFIDGKTLMDAHAFYKAAMEQAQAWIPRQKQHEFEKIMMPKFAERGQSEEYVIEAEEEYKFKRILKEYFSAKGIYTDKEQLAVHKLPYFNIKESSIDFDLDNFENYLSKQNINQARSDLVQKIQTVLKAKKKHSTFNKKSLVLWRLEGEKVNDRSIIWEGEAVEIEDQAASTDE